MVVVNYIEAINVPLGLLLSKVAKLLTRLSYFKVVKLLWQVT